MPRLSQRLPAIPQTARTVPTTVQPRLNGARVGFGELFICRSSGESRATCILPSRPETIDKVGRQRTDAQIEKLIVKLAKETGWGYTRILGELKKLGIKSISRNTVQNILKRHGLDPGPKRGVGTWDEFLKLHAATLWQCDFLSKKVPTPKGFRDLFVLVFLHVGTRRVFAAPATLHPNEAWVKEQAAAFVRHVQETGLGADIVMHDRDTKFTKSFDEVLKASKVRVQKASYRSPNTVAFVDRFIQTLGQECLDYFVVGKPGSTDPASALGGIIRRHEYAFSTFTSNLAPLNMAAFQALSAGGFSAPNDTRPLLRSRSRSPSRPSIKPPSREHGLSAFRNASSPAIEDSASPCHLPIPSSSNARRS